MRLLYWYTRFRDTNGNPREYHGLNDFELNFSTNKKYHFNPETYVLQEEDLPAEIPDGFWGDPPIYNITTIVGNNGAGKTTAINTIIDTLSEIYEGSVRSSNETVILLEDDSKTQLVYLAGRTKSEKTISCSSSKISPLGVNKNEKLEPIRRIIGLDRTKIIYLANTLSEADDYRVMKHRKKYHSRYHFVYDCSLCGVIRNWVSDDPYGHGNNVDALKLYFVDEYYKQVKFVCDYRQHKIIEELKNKCLPVPTPNQLTVTMRDFECRTNDMLFREFCRNYSLYNSRSEKLAYSLCAACFFNFEKNIQNDGFGTVNRRGLHAPNTLSGELFSHLFVPEQMDDSPKKWVIWANEYAEQCRDFVRFICNSKNEIEKYISIKSFKSTLGRDESVRFTVEVFDESINWLVQFMTKYRLVCSPNFFLDFSWGLSSGENNLLRLFATLFYAFSFSGACLHNYYGDEIQECDSVLLFMDEADLTYHPEWQRQLVQILAAFLRLSPYNGVKLDAHKK